MLLAERNANQLGERIINQGRGLLAFGEVKIETNRTEQE